MQPVSAVPLEADLARKMDSIASFVESLFPGAGYSVFVNVNATLLYDSNVTRETMIETLQSFMDFVKGQELLRNHPTNLPN